jgi:predicted site-specific integrase-resolvase
MATKTLAERAAALAPLGLTPLLKQAELLDYYGISRWTADEWVKAGCPVERLPSGGRRFKLSAVEGWRLEQLETGTQVLAEKSRHALAARRKAA